MLQVRASYAYTLIGSRVKVHKGTSCRSVVVVSKQAGRASVAHLDAGSLHSSSLLEDLACGRDQADLYLSGCYCQTQQSHDTLCHQILDLFAAAPQHFHLQLCCVAQQNTLASGAPRSQNLYVDTSNGEAYSSLDQDVNPLLPDVDIRVAASIVGTSTRLREVYDTELRCLCLQQPDVTGLSAKQAINLAEWREMSDAELLEMTSTSPQHEHPTYAAGTWPLDAV